jgi:hypothetical protein
MILFGCYIDVAAGINESLPPDATEQTQLFCLLRLSDAPKAF